MKSTKIKCLVSTARDIISIIPISSKGSYNKTDPTRFEKGGLEITKLISLSFYDCTWGVEVTLKIKTKEYSFYLDKAFGGGKDEVIFRDGFRPYHWKYLKGLLKKFPVAEDEMQEYYELSVIRRAIVKHYEKIKQPIPADIDSQYASREYFEDPMGCLSDYE